MKSSKLCLSEYNKKRLENIAHKNGVTMQLLCSIALNNEMEKERPFMLDTELPTDNIELAYTNEASKILDYIKQQLKGIELEYLILMRHDVGIEDKDRLLAGFKVLLDEDLIESYVPSSLYKGPRNADFCHWREKLPESQRKKIKKEERELKTLEKLTKKYAKGGPGDK